MSKIPVDQPLPSTSISQQIQSILADYPYYPYHSAFGNPELQQKLLIYVLSQIPSRYSISQENAPAYSAWTATDLPPIEADLLAEIIQSGIEQVLTCSIAPIMAEPVFCDPSNWLG